MPIKRRHNGQFAANPSASPQVPTAAPTIPAAAPTPYQLRDGGRPGAELRAKTYLSNLLGVRPEDVDTSGRQSFFSLRAPWYFNGIISIKGEQVQLKTHLFTNLRDGSRRMEVSVHKPGNNQPALTNEDITAMRARLQNLS